MRMIWQTLLTIADAGRQKVGGEKKEGASENIALMRDRGTGRRLFGPILIREASVVFARRALLEIGGLRSIGINPGRIRKGKGWREGAVGGTKGTATSVHEPGDEARK